MYFADAYPNLTPDQIHSSQTAERRLLLRLIAIGAVSLVILGIALL